MKTGNYYLSLAVVIGFLCVPVLGEVEPAMPDGTLLGQPNPVLAGIDKLYVIIVAPYSEPNEAGLVWEELNSKVKHKLEEAGVNVAFVTDLPDMAGPLPQSISLELSALSIYVYMLELQDSQQPIFCIQASLDRKVYLTRDTSWFVKADVWKTQHVMQTVSKQDMPDKVTDIVLEQVEEFIHAYLAANPPDKQVPEENNTGIVPKESPEPVVKSTSASQRGEPAEYKYVASKNSNVFHSPDCSSAKRIKPENLVGYRSRDEAINAGKRPCKRCKP